ncbi:PE-PPE domain-containing protein [Candidatus Mycobacterium methanotrophicum]|uniref:PE-PPE domain-containing protein n=1 Tax=Candidatus Mycobacterium methanotrophicum TaxID=2943498 RepID=A0ABY4QJA8_9MYCO|nr:PE-PPE domain-containing protein [Candidatus Mycobacterium methanotrophicum]UQX10065.1 PE-PPE domain-containing protein [Candidatus Mycobacterium methanotrophicum]
MAGVGLIAVPPTLSPGPQARAVKLTSIDTADSPLGDGTALVVGPSGIPIPPQGYVDAVDQLYLAPRGFDGTLQPVDTPEALYPITGVKSLPFDTSEAQGQQILDTDILHQIAGGHVDAENPVVVFGYSQSSVISSDLMPELAKQGVPSDDVHFVLVGDESAPNGGSLSSFDDPVGADPSVPALGLTFTGDQPSDLYPTDVYTLEYDGFADLPRYPIDELSTLNALSGITFQHLTYADLSPEQIQDAIQLPTSVADTLTNYYVIPDQHLPLLEPLLSLGLKPLYDLLEPDTRILVDLGYGSLTEGWNQGPANVATPVGFLPTDINLSQLFTDLVNGAQQGITTALGDLHNPAADQTAALDALSPLVGAAHTLGFTDATTPSQLLANPSELLELARTVLEEFAGFPTSNATLASSPSDIVNDLSGTLSADYATLLPIADTINALLTSLPTEVGNVFADQLQAGDPLAGLADGIGITAGLLPFALAYAVIPPVAENLGGTLVNLVDLLSGI